MPKRTDIKKVAVIGSGPIVIGQAAEFDYAGTQACRALREEGIEVVLINSNPATIMTDTEVADKVYLEPLTLPFLQKVLEVECPQGLLPTLGGQTALNLAQELAKTGLLERLGISLLGTPLRAIHRAEDREAFKKTMEFLKEPIPESRIVTSLPGALKFAGEVGFPLIVRPAYTLGGSGGGIAETEQELKEIVGRGLKQSIIHQVLVERSVAGWKEIEFEVMRDSNNNCITVCSMENFDPVGIHTGDSIVFAPVQTLTDTEYQMLRTASLKIIRALEIEGGCNIQFALDPGSFDYYVIEVNPRVSRSSALASKATGYPIAKVAAKIAVGLTLDEITNPVTGETTACFEPTIDYVVAKVPRWPFDKFRSVNRHLGTQMKATGEVMAIDRTIEASLMKAVRSLETDAVGVLMPELEALSDNELEAALKEQTDQRLYLLAEALRRQWTVEQLNAWTKIDVFFLHKVNNLVTIMQKLKEYRLEDLQPQDWRRLKEMAIPDSEIARLLGTNEDLVRTSRLQAGIIAVYKMVDTCAAEFEAVTPYYYSTYGGENEYRDSGNEKVIVIGSGPIRIGQGIEFDYCSVHCVSALKNSGIDAVIINNNPETVSTDFDCADRLYFEPLMLEDVLNVIEQEQPKGVIVQFGGQTAINLAVELEQKGVSLLGTSMKMIDLAEDRQKCGQLLKRLGIPQPEGATVTSRKEAMGIAQRLGFPVLVRPSYVIGGRAMEIVYNEGQLYDYLNLAAKISPEHPILIDRYLLGKEVEVDAISDGKTVLIPGVMEHVERAGVHSGDSMAIFPPQSLSNRQLATIEDYTYRIARAMEVKGLVNIQFIIHQGKVYVLEINPRASRTVPILSKVTGVPMVALATRIILGEALEGMGWPEGLLPSPPYVTVKGPVFSLDKLQGVDSSLGPEMKSTGEVLGIGSDVAGGLYRALVASGFVFPRDGGKMLVSVAEQDKEKVLPLLVNLVRIGRLEIFATSGTAAFLKSRGVKCTPVFKVGEGLPNVLDLIRKGEVNFTINTPSMGRSLTTTGYQVRRACVELKVPCFTAPETAVAFLRVMESQWQDKIPGQVCSLNDYLLKLADNRQWQER